VLLLDDRTGSVDLAPHLLRLGIKARTTRLKFGDAAFHGHGPGEEDLVIGVERKRLTDMLQSMRGHRLSGYQLPGMLETYHVSYLIIEGIWKVGSSGAIEVPSRRGGGWEPVSLGSSGQLFLYKELDKHVMSLENIAEVVVRRTSSPMETAMVLADATDWWSEPWKSHKSVYAAYIKEAQAGSRGGRVEMYRRVPGIVWKMAAQLPKIDQKGELVEKRFKTPLEMCQATVPMWQEISGIGRKTAENAVQILQGCRNG
jgi:ERCC4-type nuclease